MINQRPPGRVPQGCFGGPEARLGSQNEPQQSWAAERQTATGGPTREYLCARRAGRSNRPRAVRCCSGRAPTSESNPAAVTPRLDRATAGPTAPAIAPPPKCPMPSEGDSDRVARPHGQMTAERRSRACKIGPQARFGGWRPDPGRNGLLCGRVFSRTPSHSRAVRTAA